MKKTLIKSTLSILTCVGLIMGTGADMNGDNASAVLACQLAGLAILAVSTIGWYAYLDKSRGEAKR